MIVENIKHDIAKLRTELKEVLKQHDLLHETLMKHNFEAHQLWSRAEALRKIIAGLEDYEKTNH